VLFLSLPKRYEILPFLSETLNGTMPPDPPWEY
jgi:hypothetical protein